VFPLTFLVSTILSSEKWFPVLQVTFIGKHAKSVAGEGFYCTLYLYSYNVTNSTQHIDSKKNKVISYSGLDSKILSKK